MNGPLHSLAAREQRAAERRDRLAVELLGAPPKPTPKPLPECRHTADFDSTVEFRENNGQLKVGECVGCGETVTARMPQEDFDQNGVAPYRWRGRWGLFR